MSCCRGRIAERNFDDVVRVAPPETATAKTALELDDKKNKKVHTSPYNL